MRILLFINLIFALLVLFISRYCAYENALKFYSETLITIYHSLFCAVIAAIGQLIPIEKIRFYCLILSSTLLCLLAFSAGYASNKWPGGDDGSAIGWLVLVGGSASITFVVGIGTLLISFHINKRKNISKK